MLNFIALIVLRVDGYVGIFKWLSILAYQTVNTFQILE